VKNSAAYVVAVALILGAVLAAGCGGYHAGMPDQARNPQVAAAPLPAAFAWTSSGVLVGPQDDGDRRIVSVKDPSIVRFQDRWHLFAATADAKGGWSMVYLNFADWPDAATAPQFHLDHNTNLAGYHCAPQVFWFAPQKKWYLIFQSQQPQYSTTDDLTRPESWTAPRDFFPAKPASVKDGWIDYWIICDDTHAYLFFTGDDGRFYRSRTPLDRFPEGMSDPVVVMQDPDKFHLFEAGATYRIKGRNLFLTIIEALGPNGVRYYRGFTADRLDGAWTPLADTWEHPFAGINNVTFGAGVEPWTKDISHGELIRDGYDQTMTLDPDHLQLLYQGRRPQEGNVSYDQLPYRLGLLTLQK